MRVILSKMLIDVHYFSFWSFIIFFDGAEDSKGEARQWHEQVENDREVVAHPAAGDPSEQEVEPDTEEVHQLKITNVRHLRLFEWETKHTQA